MDKAELRAELDRVTRELLEQRSLLKNENNDDTTSRLEKALRELDVLKSKLTKDQDRTDFERKQSERMRRRLQEYALELCLNEAPTPPHVLLETSLGEMEIELARCELTPVLTLFILRKIKQGFWNHMTFFRAESHVIQATRRFANGTYAEYDKFADSIPFQEYSPEFPHHKFTLGLAGRPGGTDFYVNMVDNVRNHGPGGQSRGYRGDDPNSSDACFARIVRGEDVAREIQRQPYDRSSSGMHILKDPVEIISMRLIS